MENFIDFLTRPITGLFDRINFDVNIFSGPEYYKWAFDSNDDCEFIQNTKLAELICRIKKSELNQAQKAIAFRLGCCGKKYFSDENQKEIADFIISKWGRIGRNNPEKIRSAGMAIMAAKKKSSRQDIWLKLEAAFDKLEGISSWSKALSVADPKEFFVYDSRISVVLRLFWLAFVKDGKFKKDSPFLLIKNKAQNTLLSECLLNNKAMPWLVPNRYYKPDVKSSYEEYCKFIIELSERLVVYNKIRIDDATVHDIAKISCTDECAEDIKLIVIRQMTEMALFALIGNSLDKSKGNYGFHRAGDKWIGSRETPGFNIEKMKPLKCLINEACL